MTTTTRFALGACGSVLAVLVVLPASAQTGAPPPAPPAGSAAPPAALPPPPSPPPAALPPPPPAAAGSGAPTAPAAPAPPGAYPPGYGYPPPGQYYGPPANVAGQAPPPPLAEPRATRHTHDGFYFRGSLGVGALWLSSSFSSKEDTALAGLSGRGNGAALDILLGGTPSSGVVIGGGVSVQGSTSPTLDGAAAGPDSQLTLTTFGPFIDGYFDQRGGFHIGGALSLVGVDVGRRRVSVDASGLPSSSDRTYRAGGYGGQLWVGFEGWVASEWSLGGEFRVGAAHVDGDGNGLDGSGSARFGALLLTLVCH